MSKSSQQLDFLGFAGAVGFGSMAALMGAIYLGAMNFVDLKGTAGLMLAKLRAATALEAKAGPMKFLASVF